MIRHASTKDVFNLAVLKQQVWVDTYAREGIRHEFSQYLLKTFTPTLEQALLDDPSQRCLVAEQKDHLLGCAAICLNAVYPDESNRLMPEITQLYVLERFTGKGIGKALLDQAKQLINSCGYPEAFLTVYHENERALKFYFRQGLVQTGVTWFEMGGNRYENKIFLIKV